MHIKKLTTLSLFTVIALTIFIVESAIPMPIPIPGIKLGLSNIVTLILLLNYSPVDAFLVLLARIFLSTIFAIFVLFDIFIKTMDKNEQSFLTEIS